MAIGTKIYSIGYFAAADFLETVRSALGVSRSVAKPQCRSERGSAPLRRAPSLGARTTRLGHVIDTSLEDPNARGYRNKTELNPHTDMPDMVGLCCLRGAKDGGVSLLTSALSIHNAMAAECPQLLAPLYEGFHFHRYGEEAPGESPYTPYRIPVFSSSRGQVSARFIKTFIVAGQQAAGSPLNELQQRPVLSVVAEEHAADRVLAALRKAVRAHVEDLAARAVTEDQPPAQRRNRRVTIHDADRRHRAALQQRIRLLETRMGRPH
mgnify:CR=1 FL=1